jgi:hypothetical protein
MTIGASAAIPRQPFLTIDYILNRLHLFALGRTICSSLFCDPFKGMHHYRKGQQFSSVPDGVNGNHLSHPLWQGPRYRMKLKTGSRHLIIRFMPYICIMPTLPGMRNLVAPPRPQNHPAMTKSCFVRAKTGSGILNQEVAEILWKKDMSCVGPVI